MTDSTATSSAVPPLEPAIGILLDQSFDDWLSALRLTLDEFSEKMTGSWVFNYVEALRAVGAKPVLFCVSEQVETQKKLTHLPTGAEIIIFPPTKLFRFLRRCLPNLLYRKTPDIWHGAPVNWKERLWRGAAWMIRSYLSTPIRALFQEMRREGCHTLLVQEYESTRFDLCVLAAQRWGVRVFGTFTGAFPQFALLRPLRRIALRLCEGFIICSSGEAARVTSTYRVATTKVAVLHYPIDLKVWHPGNKENARAKLGIPQHSTVAIYHGETLLWVKGLDILLDAWELICEERPDRDLRLILIGTGADAHHLSKKLAHKHLRGVQWINQWINDRDLIQRYLSAADVYVFPSRTDAFGISIIEAMACGLPVVAGNVRGIRDIFSQGEESGGLLFPPGNAQALRLAMARLLDDSRLAQDLGQHARHNVQVHFSMDQIGMNLRSALLGRNSDDTFFRLSHVPNQ